MLVVHKLDDFRTHLERLDEKSVNGRVGKVLIRCETGGVSASGSKCSSSKFDGAVRSTSCSETGNGIAASRNESKVSSSTVAHSRARILDW